MRFPFLLTLFAFAIRIWRVDAQSLRGDEAFDVLFASQPLSEIIYQLRVNQIYPPLYHTLAHVWLMLAGTSQLSARFIALCAGVLLVPISYRLAQELFNERSARVAAILIAIHPFLIWHSQDGRMYSLLALLATMATWAAARIWNRPPLSQAGEGPGVGAWLAYILSATLAILTHYFAYVALFALNVAALWLWRRRRWPRRFYARWFAANAIVAVGGVAWIALAWARFSIHTADWIAPTAPLDVLRRSLLAYSLGTTIEWERALPFLVVFVGLAMIGLTRDRGRQTADGSSSAFSLQPSAFSLLLFTFLPLVAIYLGSLWRPMYDEKFLIFIVPCAMLLVARGVVALGRYQIFGAAAIIAGMTLSLAGYQFDPRFAKSPPWREAAQRILSQSRAGDLVVTNFPDPSLRYQIGDKLPILLLPAQGPYAAGATPLDAESAENDLANLSAQVERIWFVPQPSPNWDKDGAVARWLSRYADRDGESSFGSLQVERYLTPRAYQKTWTALNAQFADGTSLIAYRAAHSSEVVRLTLYWQATATPSEDYTVFAHLLNDAGALVAQQDNPPVNGTYPTSQWKPGLTVVDRYAIIIPSDLPAGRYRFEVGLYDASGARLRVGDDDKIVFGEVVK